MDKWPHTTIQQCLESLPSLSADQTEREREDPGFQGMRPSFPYRETHSILDHTLSLDSGTTYGFLSQTVREYPSGPFAKCITPHWGILAWNAQIGYRFWEQMWPHRIQGIFKLLKSSSQEIIQTMLYFKARFSLSSPSREHPCNRIAHNVDLPSNKIESLMANAPP